MAGGGQRGASGAIRVQWANGSDHADCLDMLRAPDCDIGSSPPTEATESSSTRKSRLRVRHQGVVAASWRLAQAFDLMEGLTCQSGSRSRQTEHGILRTEGLRAASRDVRAAKAAAGQDGFCATWPIEISWGAMSGDAGEPSGATRRPRGRPARPPGGPHAQGRSRRKSPAGERG